MQEESDVDGEISPADYELIVDTIRTTLHDEGTVSAFGRTFTWSSRVQSSKGRNVSVTLSPRNGRTRIRIDERLGQLAAGLYGGIVGGTSSMAVWAATSAFRATHAILPTVLAAVAVELTTFSIARTILGFTKGKRERQLAALRAQLEAEVRASIAAGSPDSSLTHRRRVDRVYGHLIGNVALAQAPAGVRNRLDYGLYTGDACEGIRVRRRRAHFQLFRRKAVRCASAGLVVVHGVQRHPQSVRSISR